MAKNPATSKDKSEEVRQVPEPDAEAAAAPAAAVQTAELPPPSESSGPAEPGALIGHFGGQPDDGKPKVAGFQWEIIYEVRRADGKLIGEKEVHVTAATEHEAFDLAQKAVEAITDDGDPIRWRYTGRFRKIAA